jgi:hypothetical protein
MFFSPSCNWSLTQKFTIIWEIQKHQSIHELTLHFKKWNFVVLVSFFTEHIQHQKCQPAAGRCSVCRASKQVIGFACGFHQPLGLDWGGGSLAHISNKCWTTLSWNFCSLFGYHMLEWYKHSKLFNQTGKKYLFPPPCSVTNWTGISYSSLFVDIHMVTVVFNNARLMSSPTFITKVAFCWCFIYMSVCTCFICLSKPMWVRWWTFGFLRHGVS